MCKEIHVFGSVVITGAARNVNVDDDVVWPTPPCPASLAAAHMRDHCALVSQAATPREVPCLCCSSTDMASRPSSPILSLATFAKVPSRTFAIAMAVRTLQLCCERTV
eukprot:6476753-Amphidinium_carterae.1